MPDEFEEFINKVTKRHPICLPTLISGMNIADVMLRYEHLTDDFAEFVRGFGIKKVPELPQAKAETRPSDTYDYRKLYNDRTRKVVEAIYRWEIEEFGYEF